MAPTDHGVLVNNWKMLVAYFTVLTQHFWQERKKKNSIHYPSGLEEI